MKSYQKKSTQTDFKMLDAEQIAARRIPIEDAEIDLGKTHNWHCHYCSRRFAGENTFMKHLCEPKRRAAELLSPLGQAAFGYYRQWMKMKKYSQPGGAAFLESKYYRSFINFAQLMISANVSNPDRYMTLMVEADIQPVLWCRDSCYAVYLEWMDKASDPLDEVQASINYLLDICEKESCELSGVFDHMGAQRVLSLIRQRRLTPWLLFCSKSFGKMLGELDKSQLSAFNVVVNSGYWSKKFETEKGTLRNIKIIVEVVGL